MTTIVPICFAISTSGTYILDYETVSKFNSSQLSKIRSKQITFVFQNFALMEKYTAFKNIELPLVNQNIFANVRRKKVIKVTKQFGIENQLHKLPKQMSGGQQQRIALARALVSGADIIFAGEPPGTSDQKNGMALMELLRKLNEDGKTIILVTHDSTFYNCLLCKENSHNIRWEDFSTMKRNISAFFLLALLCILMTGPY